jgi:1-acyl-sn-glycerol-3-phosphate acyltransferase
MKTNSSLDTVRFSPHLPWRNRAFRWLVRFACHLLFKVKITGGENLPKSNCIVIANHLSWIDHLLLMTVLPAEPRPYLVGASQSISSPFKAWLLRTFGGVIPFERGAHWVGRNTFVKPLQVLASGSSLVLFPEGDVSGEEGRLLPLKRGIGHFALQADHPIVPIALSGVKELYWRKPIQMIIGKPFRVQIEGQNRRAAIDAAVQQVDSALRGLLPHYVEPRVTRKWLRFLTDLSDGL